MQNAASRARRVMLLVVCHMAVTGQGTELAPLLPAETETSREVRAALLAGATARAVVLVDGLPGAERPLWRGILAIVRNDATGAIRELPRQGQPKALGVAYYLARQHVLFREQMAEAIRLAPDDFGPYYYLGRHYDADVGDSEEAAKWFRLALARKGDFARARSYLGSCLERLGQDAEQEYMASLAVPQSLVGLARLRLAAGDGAAAARFVETAMAMDPRDAGAMKLAARVYAAAGRGKDATRVLEAAARVAPRDAGVRFQLWKSYQAAGDGEKAAGVRKEFERLRAIYGGSF